MASGSALALPPPLRRALEALPFPDAPLPPPIAAAEHRARLRAVLHGMGVAGLDAILVGAGPFLRYLTGLAFGPTERAVALFLPREGVPRLLCPRFETGSVAEGLAFPVEPLPWDEHENPVAILSPLLKHAARLGLDPETPFRFSRALSEQRADLLLTDAGPVLERVRCRKSAAELAIMQHAMRLTAHVHRAAAAALEPGLRASEIRRFVDLAHRALGAPDGASFCAVQFDRATAFPHGIPGDQILARDALVLVDTGCVLHGYQSDMTRCWRIGGDDSEQERIWRIESEAQHAAFAAARPGVAAEAVDAAARRVLEAHGLGPGYDLPGLPHRTGHGIGLSIHEPAYIVRGNAIPLEPGMCFSIEPMIVVPERFGIRLEDCVHITETGAAWFTEPASDWRPA
ncbi:Xaa-Pro peptidase family protein [Acetobacteraceae bacterium KSS8]|uniref:Xaa-Pro peptidase family protein n=1 Tax=Endosaccharibacter trunci TaxID=2812733 RepID=A0ABT1W9T0_9PROT|nr:Xaa-Pro peptidase family protein [Acetobacteraceae bacterium KSS8]